MSGGTWSPASGSASARKRRSPGVVPRLATRSGRWWSPPGSPATLMRLYLLLHKRFPPYSKWLGTALHRLPGADMLAVPLARALSTTGAAREEHLCRAYTAAAGAGNATGLTGPVDPTTRPYYDRPFQVLDAGRFSRALLAAITDPAVAALPGVGAIDQFADSTA